MNNNCIFCKIVNKEIPASINYEDDNFIGFLDKFGLFSINMPVS